VVAAALVNDRCSSWLTSMNHHLEVSKAAASPVTASGPASELHGVLPSGRGAKKLRRFSVKQEGVRVEIESPAGVEAQILRERCSG
jgi:hypothetical protein